jgi:transcriptional regulator with PAS, ATPase and Fis domain
MPKAAHQFDQQRSAGNGSQAAIPGFNAIIGQSTAIVELKRRLERIARTDVNVLITGETGTGKELVAAAIHEASRRSRHNFVCVNCAALPDSLFESELFGHTRGAYTGAFQSRLGRLRESDGGTVFLDEIGELSLQAQAKLLRAIETREIQMLGGGSPAHADFRLIAATNQELETRINDGLFRRDLYYRLNVARVHLPVLRERMDDLPLLIRHCVERLNRQFGMDVEGVAPDAMRLLVGYAWPGNVRELRNLLESAYLSVVGSWIEIGDLPRTLWPAGWKMTNDAGNGVTEKDRLLQTLREVNWNKSKAAAKLHWSRMTLYRKLAKYRVEEGEAQAQEAGM